MADDKGSLPPGWDMKFDARTGKFYFINHYTKTTSWEDPRDRYQQIGKAGTKEKENKEPDPMTGLQGSSSLVPLANQQVASMRRELEAEQENRGQLRSSSPGARYGAPQMGYAQAHASLGRLQLDTEPYESPLPSQRSTLRRDSHILAEISEMDSTFTNQESEGETEIDVDDLFATINDLIEEMENNDNPETSDSANEFRETNEAITVAPDLETSRPLDETNEAISIAPDLENSRYLKSVFPTVEEYLLLDVLANSENNVQKTSDKLSKMGYVRRETPSAPRLHAKRKEEERLAEKRTPLPKPPPIKTEKEKMDLRRKLKDKYEKKFDIPERILFMALESVLFDEDQANSLIQSMIEDDLRRQKEKDAARARERAEKKKSPKPVRKVVEAERPKPSSPKKVPRQAVSQDKRGFQKHSVRILEENDSLDGTDRADEGRTLSKGPNPALRKGPNDDLLLTNYVTWNGPNAALRKGPNSAVANGPNPENLRGPRARAGGPNLANRKGPQGLAKGSIYSDFKPEAEIRAI